MTTRILPAELTSERLARLEALAVEHPAAGDVGLFETERPIGRLFVPVDVVIALIAEARR